MTCGWRSKNYLSLNWACCAWFLSTFVGVFALPAHAQSLTAEGLTPEQLAPAILTQLQSSGLLNKKIPVPAFQWQIEQQRPLGRKRTIQENFSASATGLSFVQAEIQFSDSKNETREYLSARGLEHFDKNDQQANLSFNNLELPIKVGQKFSRTLTKEKTPVTQNCEAKQSVVAATLHSALPGKAVQIECHGETQFAGMNLKGQSIFFYLEKLGVFFSQSDGADSPLGRFGVEQRISQFQLSDKTLEPK